MHVHCAGFDLELFAILPDSFEQERSGQSPFLGFQQNFEQLELLGGEGNRLARDGNRVPVKVHFKGPDAQHPRQRRR